MTGSSASAPSTATGTDCNVQAPGPSGIAGVFADVAGFTVKQICPADVGPFFANPQVMAGFGSSVAGQLSQDQSAVMRVFAGELTSGSGDTFVHTFLSQLSASAAPTKTVATDTEELGGQSVTYFNVPLDVSGYAYAAGSTVVIAMNTSGAPDQAAKDGFTRILGNLH